MKKMILTLVAVLLASAAQALPRQDVMVGGDADYDPCSTGIALATTTFVSKDENGFFEFGTVKVNETVIICDRSEDGEFMGVVISEEDQDCGLGSPIPHRQPYNGSCKSGWVKKEFILFMAG